ncbi:glycosyltransferase [Uniformispora flossi]|uniref:glycosyltransferase n=1 Tax=Uniformispora flossi TaxID=3390723 RepID=UPI003C30197F
MRVLVIPHDMQLGGSSINALDLARAVRERGHDVRVLARGGPLRDRLAATGLPIVEAPEQMSMRPSPAVLRAVRDTVRRHRIDVVHAYEYWPTLEAYLGARGAAVVGSIMSMGSLPPYVPPVTLTLGYGDLHDEVTAQRGTARSHLLEPPIDTDWDDRATVDLDAFRTAHDLPAGPPTFAIVSRLARSMKQESIERCIDAVAVLDPELPGIRLLVVGGGSAEEDIRRRADKVNAGLGRRAVVLTGPLDDPRAAYACADIVCGMGSSVLRGMALGTAAVVVGERGFTEPVRPDTIPVFDRLGFYGVGEGLDPAADPLPGMLLDLFQDTDRRRELDSWSAELVRGRMSLKRQTDRLLKCYEAAIADRRPFAERGRERANALGHLVAYKGSELRRARRLKAARTRTPGEGTAGHG